MRHTVVYTIGLLLFFSAGLPDTVQARQEESDDGNKVDMNICRLIEAVDTKLMSKHLFYLAKDPLPCRKLNLTLLGHKKNTFRGPVRPQHKRQNCMEIILSPSSTWMVLELRRQRKQLRERRPT